MARSNTTKAKSDEGSEGQASLMLAGGDALADVLGDVDLPTTGLEELDASDIRMGSLVWNFKGIVNEEPVAPNRFFNTITEEVTAEEELALLTLHKSNRWTEFDQAEQKTKTRCSSWDRKTGEMDDGTVRSCDGCPDKQWRRDPESGKRRRNCSDVANVVGLRLKDGQPVVLRFTRTSERPWVDYLNRHIIGKRIVNGKRSHMPLFAYPTRISLKMEKRDGTSWAVPVLERGEQHFSREEIVFFAESAKAYRESQLDEVRQVAESSPDEATDDEGAPQVVDANEFADDDLGGGDAPRGKNHF